MKFTIIKLRRWANKGFGFPSSSDVLSLIEHYEILEKKLKRYEEDACHTALNAPVNLAAEKVIMPITANATGSSVK